MVEEHSTPMTPALKKKVVVFFGSDGTGKTTQAKLVMKYFNERGFKTSRAWIRGRHSFAFFVSQVLLKLGYRGYFVAPYAPGGKILDSRTLPGKKVWSLLEFASVVPLLIRRMYLPLMLGYRVVAERYVIDTVIYNEYYIGPAFDTFARILLHMIPPGALIVHMDASIDDVMARRIDDKVSEKFIEYQLASYRRFATSFRAISINSSMLSIEEVRKRIEQELSYS